MAWKKYQGKEGNRKKNYYLCEFGSSIIKKIETQI